MAGRRLSSYVKKYDKQKPGEGKDIHRRLQRMSGLKSAHARKMKKLRESA